MNYKEIYLKAIGDDEKIETITRINDIAYDMMMNLEDPELFEVLKRVNPGSDIQIVFLDLEDDINEYFASPADIVSIIRNNYPIDLSYEFLVIRDGSAQAVDAIKDIECGWDDVFYTAVMDVLWDYIDPESDPEMKSLFQSLIPRVETLTELIVTAAKQIIEDKFEFAPGWVEEWTIEGVKEYAKNADAEWIADYLVSGKLESDIARIVGTWC